MSKIISIFLLFFMVLCAYAQPLNKVTPENRLEIAAAEHTKGNLVGALEFYEASYKERSNKDVAYKIANLHYQLRDYNQAEKWFAKVLKRDEKGKYPAARFAYARSIKMNGDFERALVEFNKFRSKSNNDVFAKLYRAEVDGIKLALGSQPDPLIRIQNAGENLNDRSTEFSPVYYKDNEIYYAAINSNSKIVLDGTEEDYYAKIFRSTKQAHNWSKGVALDENINKPGEHNGNVCFDKGGQTMYFTRAILDNNKLLKSDIYYSELINGQWSKAKQVEGVNGDFINKHPHLATYNGKQVLFFVSDRKGGVGGMDLYFAGKLGNGKFSSPRSLGDKINTVGDELTPSFYNGKLYFSSTGHMTIGGLDVFESQWKNNNWTTPHNVGKPINSPLDDFYFSKNADGTKGFIVSNRPNERSLKSPTCCDEIYQLTFKEKKPEVKPPKPPKPEPLVFSAEVLTIDSQTGETVKGTTVALLQKEGNRWKEIASESNTFSNSFVFELQPDKVYQILVKKSGYEDNLAYVSTIGKKKSEKSTHKVPLKKVIIAPPPPPPVEEEIVYINQAIQLNNIYYDYNDDKILSDAEKDLNVMLDLMARYPDMVIELSSHTDSRGGGDYNKKLSQRRANSARNWLVSRGVTYNRIKAIGYGESRLKNQCADGVKCTDEEHKVNRRTEFKIIAGPTSIRIPRRR